MPVNPITGIVTYTLDEWKEESQLWERDGALRERERIIKLLEEVVSNWRKADLHNQADTFDYAIALIKGEK